MRGDTRLVFMLISILRWESSYFSITTERVCCLSITATSILLLRVIVKSQQSNDFY